MDLKEVKKNWEEFGTSDPFWAILAEPSKGGKWDVNEFFAVGAREVARIVKRTESLRLTSAHRRALDFGCGVGRLTQPLGARFDEAIGVDISSSMVRLADSLNTTPNCTFIVNERSDLSVFPDGHFDFILSLITLQHMESRFAKTYLQEFMRVLSPSGILYFQIPEQVKIPTPYRRAKAQIYYRVVMRYRIIFLLFRALLGSPRVVMEMHGMLKNEVISLIQSAGGKVEFIEELPDAGPNWTSYRYCVRRLQRL